MRIGPRADFHKPCDARVLPGRLPGDTRFLLCVPPQRSGMVLLP
jgi:hypothetical protein